MPIVNIMLRETKAVRNIIKGESAKPASRTSDIKIEEIRELKTPSKDSNAVIIEFFYHSKYGLKDSKNSLGSIEIRGDIVYVNSKEEIKNILDSWIKDKKIESKLMGGLLNAALNKSTIEAIEQAAKVGLPSPIPLPVLRPGGKPASKTSAS